MKNENMKNCPDFETWLQEGECVHESDGACNMRDSRCPYLFPKEEGFSLRQKELADWQEKNFPKSLYEDLSRDDLINRIRILELSVGMAEEVGELSHIILKASQKIREGASGKIDKDMVADGFSDTVIYGIQLMTKLGIDAEKVLADTIQQILNRDWSNNRTSGDLSDHYENRSINLCPDWINDREEWKQKEERDQVILAFDIYSGADPLKILRLCGITFEKYGRNDSKGIAYFYGCRNLPDKLPRNFSIVE